MSNLENLEAIKRMIEKVPEEEDKKVSLEKRFIADVSAYLKGDIKYEVTGVQAYDPLKMIEFLGRKSTDVQKLLGGEWETMDANAFETLAYTVRQKVQKSAMLLDWKS